MKNFTALFLISIFCLGWNAKAVPTISAEPELWYPGVHIFASAGLNFATFQSDTRNDSLGFGSNLKTDVLYLISDDWAFETSAAVKFHSVDESTIWDSLFTVGLRSRFSDPIFSIQTHYWRAFVGASPTVIFLNDQERTDFKASRLHAEGPVFGVGAGTYFQSENKKHLYFFELNLSAQFLRHIDNVISEGDTPVIVSSSAVQDNSAIYTVLFNVGILVF